MERPRSEGLLSSSSPRGLLLRRHPHRSESHRRHRKHASQLSQSCNLIFNSEAQESAIDALQVVQSKDDSYGHPRRPKTTPKPRIERLLVGPGKAHIMHAAQLSPTTTHDKSASFFMTHLPDSPPRHRRSFPPSSSEELESDAAEDREDGEQARKVRSLPAANPIEAPRKPSTNEATETTGPTPELHQHRESLSESPIESLMVSGARVSLTSGDDEEVQQDTDAELISSSSQKVEDENDVYAPHEEDVKAAESHDHAHERTGSLGPLCVDAITQRSTLPSAIDHPQRVPDEIDEQGADNESQDCDSPVLSSDDEEDTMEQHTTDSLPFAPDSVVPCIDDDGDEYTRSLAARKELQDAEDERERLRDELQTYVTSLTSRKGDDGAQWLEFPKNYDHVLSLMSERDLRDEATASNSSGPISVNNSSQRSWSHVLLQTGLAKQQAFDMLIDDDSGNDAESSLAANIALKMARVRQLDAILEEKLGKHVYSASNSHQGSKFGAKKPKPVASPPVQARNQEPEPGATRGGGMGKTFVTQPNSVAKESTGGLNHLRSVNSCIAGSRQDESFISTKPQNGDNFVERNKKVIACGMKPVLSQDEETRLNRLLRDADTDATASAASSMESSSVAKLNRTTVEDRNEFAMDASEKKQIEELVVAKRGAYQSSLLGSFGDDGNDESDAHADTGATASNSNTVNTIQATKKERLRKQRLDRIEQELAFLSQSEGCLTIVADDDEVEAVSLNDGETDSVFDGTMSDRSYRTTTSTATSVCSLRSGVISRRQFNEFLVAETRKLSSTAGTNSSVPSKASPEEIQRLVSSLSHLMTSRPVV
ncbi:hypothetical protein FI667_g6626, partial [Globisporangium splendens]